MKSAAAKEYLANTGRLFEPFLWLERAITLFSYVRKPVIIAITRRRLDKACAA